jgi:hypothetical protein
MTGVQKLPSVSYGEVVANIDEPTSGAETEPLATNVA